MKMRVNMKVFCNINFRVYAHEYYKIHLHILHIWLSISDVHSKLSESWQEVLLITDLNSHYPISRSIGKEGVIFYSWKRSQQRPVRSDFREAIACSRFGITDISVHPLWNTQTTVRSTQRWDSSANVFHLVFKKVAHFWL